MSQESGKEGDNIVLPDPDISFDLDRLKQPTSPPTKSPAAAPTGNPTNAPTGVPTSVPTSSPTNDSTTASTTASTQSSTTPQTNEPSQTNNNNNPPTKTRTTTYYSCPEPPTEIIHARDTNGNPVTFDNPPPVSTVTIEYDFELQLLSLPSSSSKTTDRNTNGEEETQQTEEYIQSTILPSIQQKMGNAVAEFMKIHTENPEDETICSGYFVDEWRKRRREMRTRMIMSTGEKKIGESASVLQHELQLQQVEVMPQHLHRQQLDHHYELRHDRNQHRQFPTERTRLAEKQSTTTEALTKIITLTTSPTNPYSIDEHQSCIPHNDGCYVVKGQMDATYVGYNEASVRSSVEHMVKNEMMTSGEVVTVPSSSSSSSSSSGEVSYQLKYLGPHSDGLARTANTPSAINVGFIGDLTSKIPESEGGLSPVGIGITVILCATLVMALYAVFVNDGRAEPIVEKVKEKRSKNVKKKQKGKKKSRPLVAEEGVDDDNAFSHHYDLEAVGSNRPEEEDSADFMSRIELQSVNGTSQRSGNTANQKSSGSNVQVAAAATTIAIASLSQAESDANKYSTRSRSKSITHNHSQHSSNKRGPQQQRSTTPNSALSYSASSSDAINGPNAAAAIHAGISISGGSIRSTRSANEQEKSTPVRTNRSNVKIANFGSGPPLVDRTPSTSSTGGGSVVSTHSAHSANNSTSGASFRLQTVPEADLPPPIHDTPHRSKYPIVSPSSQNSSEFWREIGEIDGNTPVMDSIEVSEVVHHVIEDDLETWEV